MTPPKRGSVEEYVEGLRFNLSNRVGKHVTAIRAGKPIADSRRQTLEQLKLYRGYHEDKAAVDELERHLQADNADMIERAHERMFPKKKSAKSTKPRRHK